VTGGPEPTSIAAAAGITSDSDLATETLADLYLAQGFAQRAAEVYQALVEQRPRDDRLAAKLHDAETAAAAGHGADVSEDARDVWLRDVEAAWTGGAGVTAQEPTPYAWTEREEREQEIGIGAYLRGLISWGTGEAARQAEPSTETVAPESATVAGPGPAEAPAPAKPEPDWLAELTWGGTDIAEAGLEPAGEPHETAETGATGLWATHEETLLDATWTAPEPSKSWSADVEAPADPWLSAEPAAIAGAPAASPSPPVNPVEEAFNEWFGSPPEPGVPVTPPPHSGAVSGRDAGADRTRVGAAAGEEEEDEDLEMFRAWLQSLKK
jgi:hypothetical protein